MYILGIETSCDETALSVIETRSNSGHFECRILASLIHSQAELHSAYGGVFPNLAKREHQKNLPILLERILDIPEIKDRVMTGKPPVDAIAVTEGPGLEPALWTGISMAEELGKRWGVPIVPVNHLEGHIVGSLLSSDAPDGTWQRLIPLDLPALALIISGGHTELVSIINDKSSGTGAMHASSDPADADRWLPILGSPEACTAPVPHLTIIGSTKDDAAGEAFDKVARLLELPYPGGPHLSRRAEEARSRDTTSSVQLPRPMIHSKDLNFSFSGLKTAALYAVRDAKNAGVFDEKFKLGLAREFEDSVTETVSTKVRKALETIRARALIVGGGVSANQHLRDELQQIATEYDIPVYLPSRHISGDNALMIALAGALHQSPQRPLKAHGTKRIGS